MYISYIIAEYLTDISRSLFCVFIVRVGGYRDRTLRPATVCYFFARSSSINSGCLCFSSVLMPRVAGSAIFERRPLTVITMTNPPAQTTNEEVRCCFICCFDKIRTIIGVVLRISYNRNHLVDNCVRRLKERTLTVIYRIDYI